MYILGIETSCDETAAAIIEDGVKIISNVKATSFASKSFGGVVPDKTAREQLKFILPVIAQATKDVPLNKVDALAVTYGPGLIGSLLIGVETAKTLALATNKPLIPINHLLGHIYATWLDSQSPTLPALVLIASGGHCELVYMTAHGQFKLLGSTRDDAAGECFDKCGRLLGLPYPYGPYIEVEAAKHQMKNKNYKITLPRPLLNQKNWEFSFSGLKTAFLYNFNQAKEKGLLNDQYKAALAHELQESITDVLTTKFLRAAAKFQTSALILTGGVAANSRLREKMSLAMEQWNNGTTKLHIPPVSLCTDNAAYIASAAFFNYHPKPINKINAEPGLDL